MTRFVPAFRSLVPVVAGVMLVGLGGCAEGPPTTPSFTALPGKNQSYPRFEQEDAYCRSNAYTAAGGKPAHQNGVNHGLETAGAGTLLGAAAGALIGAAAGDPGAGAAIGAGTGLAFGGIAGADEADASDFDLQRRFDQVYAQCMVAYGNLVPVPQAAPYPVAVSAYPYPYGYGYGGPGLFGPSVGVGFGYGRF